MSTRLGLLPPKKEVTYTRPEEIAIRDGASKIPFSELVDNVISASGNKRTYSSVKSKCYALGFKLGSNGP